MRRRQQTRHRLAIVYGREFAAIVVRIPLPARPANTDNNCGGLGPPASFLGKFPTDPTVGLSLTLGSPSWVFWPAVLRHLKLPLLPK